VNAGNRGASILITENKMIYQTIGLLPGSSPAFFFTYKS